MAFAVSSVLWDLMYRRAQPYDIDEAGYLVMSLLDYRALGEGGLWSWLQQVEAPSIQSPLTTAAATPVYLVFGPRPAAALLVPLAFSLVAIAATYGLARRIGGRSVALGAAVLMASAPVVVNYSRDDHFAAAATAVTTTALYCMQRADRFLSWRWSMAFGAAIGLMPLARTMTVAFIPGFAVAAAVYVIAGDRVGRRLANLVLAAGTASAVAATWLGVNGNGRLVWNYLTAYGYGAVSQDYGAGQESGILSLSSWRAGAQLFAHYVLLPHLLVFASAGVVIACLATREVVATRRVRPLATSPLLAPVSVVFGALVSSANQGSAFSAPLVPALCVVAAWTLFRVFRTRRSIAAAIIGSSCVIAAVPALPIAWPLAGTWTVSVPYLGIVPVASGQGPIQQYTQGAGAAGTHRDTAAPLRGREWVAANGDLAAVLEGRYGKRAFVVFGFRHRLLNPNSVNLAQVAAGGDQLPVGMVPRETVPDSLDGYRAWLTTGTAETACLLLTATGQASEIQPIVTGSTMVAAAEAEGFVRLKDVMLPDSRVMTIWERPASCPT